MIYVDSITGQVYMDVDAWAKALHESNGWLKRNTQQEIIEFMNNREKICTPGFLIRRHIQKCFPEIMEKAAAKAGISVGDVEDLSKLGNVPWDENFLKALANVLAGTVFEDYGGKIVEALQKVLAGTEFENYGEKFLDGLFADTDFRDYNGRMLEARQWVNYLEDDTLCQRATAIKLIFALKLDEETASKFLISNDNTLLSARNPFDFICNFCLKCQPRISYEEACELLVKFDMQRRAARAKNKAEQKPTSGMTADMTNEITTLAQDGSISADGKKQKLLAYMLANEGEFVGKVPKKNQRALNEGVLGMRYPSGFSFQNITRLKQLINYLAMIYPKDIALDKQDKPVKVPIEMENGVAKIYDLMKSMYYSQNIEFKDHLELDLPARGAALNEYNKIPFTHDVLLQLKNLSDTLRAVMRASKHPANAQDISRSTVMILAYFFITGYLYADEVTLQALVGQLKQDEKSTTDSNAKGLIEALRAVTKNLDKIPNADEPIKIYIAALNWILRAFHFNEFYPLFVLDRFIVICLLANPLDAPIRDEYENSLQFLMQLVISESYN